MGGIRARAQGTEVPGARSRNLQDHDGEHGDDAQQKTSGASSERLIGEFQYCECVNDGGGFGR